ncbi:ANTAR domain-containing protein [Streptomyces sp. NPDC096040]|uniref:ANTAR domain-containing protein n=1 Tax=Streptomyces sp. NPDC096040 TaxID=3155541 RepID=UPI00332FDC04
MQQRRIPHSAGAAGAKAAGTPAVDMPYEPEIRTWSRDGTVTVVIRGELDIAGEPVLKSALEDAVNQCRDHVELDLGGVGFCDCSGLNVLLAARRHAAGQGKTLSVGAIGPAVTNLLIKTGTWPLLAGTWAAKDARSGETEDALSDEIEDAPGAEDLLAEVAHLRRAMRTRPAIDQATGVLMATFSLTSEDAWAVLVTVSQNTNTKLHHIAEEVLAAVQGDSLPDGLQTQLAAAVGALRADEGSSSG